MTSRRSRFVAPWASALALVAMWSSLARAAPRAKPVRPAPPPTTVEPAPKPAAPSTPPAAPELAPSITPNDADWRQIMMAPAITGDLRTIAVDPSDERNIYVGTQEGTLAHSIDGGVTWTETALSPFTARSPTIGFRMIGDPKGAGDYYKRVDVFAGYRGAKNGINYEFRPFARASASADILRVGPRFNGAWVDVWRFVDSYPWATNDVLGSVASAEPVAYDLIRDIAICPGGSNTVLVATDGKLLGSADGERFVELYTGRESARVEQVSCSRIDPNEVVLTTGDGTFRSLDGGFSFETIGQVGSTAVAFGPPIDGAPQAFYLVAGGDLWIGFSNQADVMHAVSVGAEGRINDISVTPKAIWLATDSGVRVSRDGGTTWNAIDELEGFRWQSVSVARGSGGQEHVLVLREDMTFLSTDGIAFSPSFRAESRRRLRWTVSVPSSTEAPPAFMVVTSGEVWTSRARDRYEDPKLASVRAMAARRLKAMPSLRDLLDRAVARERLSDAQVDAISARWTNRAWLPGFRIDVGAERLNALARSAATVTDPQEAVSREPITNIYARADLIWELPDFVTPTNIASVRSNLYEVRKRFSYFIEDAYLERRNILSQLASGGLNEEQSLTLQARLEVLDVVLEEFTAGSGKH